MSTTFTSELSAEDAKYKAEIEKISVQIAHEIELMRKEREEFERSSVRTDAMIDQLLVQLGMRCSEWPTKSSATKRMKHMNERSCV